MSGQFNQPPAADYSAQLPPQPVDPFNEVFLRFNVLQQLGYPVAIQPITRDAVKAHGAALKASQEEGEGRLQDPLFDERAAAIDRYDKWFQPIVRDLAFSEWTWNGLPSELDGKLLSSREQALEDHPAHSLGRAVDLGDPRSIRAFIQSVRRDGHPIMEKRANFMPVFQSAYLRAMERYREEVKGPIEREFWYIKKPQEYDLAFEKALQANRVRPVTALALGTIIEDYYRLAEHVYPELAAFKKPIEFFQKRPVR